jgi:hypothetical protein
MTDAAERGGGFSSPPSGRVPGAGLEIGFRPAADNLGPGWQLALEQVAGNFSWVCVGPSLTRGSDTESPVVPAERGNTDDDWINLGGRALSNTTFVGGDTGVRLLRCRFERLLARRKVPLLSVDVSDQHPHRPFVFRGGKGVVLTLWMTA